jgi:hypothetical protein
LRPLAIGSTTTAMDAFGVRAAIALSVITVILVALMLT